VKFAAWHRAERRIAAYQRRDEMPIIDRLDPAFVAELDDLDALALRWDPRSYLRLAQTEPPGDDWMIWLLLTGRGWGKSHAAAAWVISRVLAHDSGDYAIVAPTQDDTRELQIEPILALTPPWIRVVERATRGLVEFPDQGVTLRLHTAQDAEYRGPNLRGAWLEEPVKYPNGEKLWRNLRLALRMPGAKPPRAVITTTPPESMSWILDVAAARDTYTTRGTMRENPMLDVRAVAANYAALAHTVAGQRELDGRVIIGVDGALFKATDLDRFRVKSAPALDQIVVAVDPAQSGRKDADQVGIVVVAIGRGHLYVLDSMIARMEPAAWAVRVIDLARAHNAGRICVEPTGSGSFPKATLQAQFAIGGGSRVPIVESPARGSKADRAQPLSAAAAQGLLHIVGSQPTIEHELCAWFPGAKWSPGGLDALVHGAALITNNWVSI